MSAHFNLWRSNLKKLNATAIKLIACALMFCDHVHQMFYHVGAPVWLTWLGRPVFPMFLFASAESFHYTRNRKKYIIRLGIAAVLAKILFLTVQKIWPSEQVMLVNNAFSTFFISAWYMMAWDRLRDGIREKKTSKVVTTLLLCLVPMLTALPTLLIVAAFPDGSGWLFQSALLLAMSIPNLLYAEGGVLMVALGVAFYVLRSRRWAQIAALGAVSVLQIVQARGWDSQALMFLAAVPMLLYDGQRGRGFKYFFYIFYPVHILALYFLSVLLFPS